MAESASPCDAIVAELAALDARTEDMEDVWHERPEPLARLVERAEREACDDLAQQLKWESMLAYAYTSNAAVMESDRPRFVTFHPELAEEPALDYLVSRVSASSVHVRSRVLDFLWEYGGPTRRRHAVEAGATYLEAAKIEIVRASTENHGWIRAGDALIRSAQLAKSANQQPTTRAVAETCLELVNEFRGRRDWREVLEIGLALCEVASSLTAEEAQAIDGTLEATSGAFLGVGSYHLARMAMSVRRRFAVANKQADSVVRAIDIAIAQSCLDEGKRREDDGNNLVASVAYNEAVQLFEKIGSERQSTEAARTALRRTREAGIGEMTRITSGPIQLTPEQQAHMEGLITAVATAAEPDCFRLLALHPDLLVTRAQALETQRQMQAAAPLTQMLPRAIFRGGGQVLAPSDPAEAHRLRLFQMAVSLLRIQDGLYLNSILERLIARDDLGPEAVIRYFGDSGHIPANSLPIIEVGVRRLWERDWVSALHILIPQLEETMRSMMRQAGRDTMRTHRDIPGVTLEVPLGYVLNGLASVIVDDGVIFMLEVVLDLYGMNLRNQFGHGLANIGDCSIDNAARILQLYLILCGLRSQPPGAKPDPEHSPEAE